LLLPTQSLADPREAVPVCIILRASDFCGKNLSFVFPAPIGAVSDRETFVIHPFVIHGMFA
jgi:hypothetical protein